MTKQLFSKCSSFAIALLTILLTYAESAFTQSAIAQPKTPITQSSQPSQTCIWKVSQAATAQKPSKVAKIDWKMLVQEAEALKIMIQSPEKINFPPSQNLLPAIGGELQPETKNAMECSKKI
jgi:hypothetical protein